MNSDGNIESQFIATDLHGPLFIDFHRLFLLNSALLDLQINVQRHLNVEILFLVVLNNLLELLLFLGLDDLLHLFDVLLGSWLWFDVGGDKLVLVIVTLVKMEGESDWLLAVLFGSALLGGTLVMFSFLHELPLDCDLLLDHILHFCWTFFALDKSMKDGVGFEAVIFISDEGLRLGPLQASFLSNLFDQVLFLGIFGLLSLFFLNLDSLGLSSDHLTGDLFFLQLLLLLGPDRWVLPVFLLGFVSILDSVGNLLVSSELCFLLSSFEIELLGFLHRKSLQHFGFVDL